MIRSLGLVLFYVFFVSACGQQDTTQQKSPVTTKAEQPAPNVDETIPISAMTTEEHPKDTKDIVTAPGENAKLEMAASSLEAAKSSVTDITDQR